MLNCAMDIQVIAGQQNGYYAAIVVNWNDNVAQALTLDFALAGAANSFNQACQVWDMWNGQALGTFVGFMDTPLINPHDNQAYMIKC